MKRVACALAALLLAASLTGCADWPDWVPVENPEPATGYDGAVIDAEAQTVTLYVDGEPVQVVPVIRGAHDAP